MFLEILQYSQENTSVGVFLITLQSLRSATLLKRDSITGGDRHLWWLLPENELSIELLLKVFYLNKCLLTFQIFYSDKYIPVW